ncbi:hypothetical protein ACYZT2_19030 [Pseudomonas sp. MDT1-85]
MSFASDRWIKVTRWENTQPRQKSSASSTFLFMLSAASVTGLVTYERRLAEPLLDVRFFLSVPFSGATLIAVIVFGCFAAMLFLNSLYLQQERGFSAAGR